MSSSSGSFQKSSGGVGTMEEIPPGQEMLETQMSAIDVAEIVRVRYRCSTLIDLAWSQALQDKRAKIRD